MNVEGGMVTGTRWDECRETWADVEREMEGMPVSKTVGKERRR